MKLLVSTFIAIIVIAQAQKDIDDQWRQYKENFKKSYRSVDEDNYRKAMFVQQLERIEEHNQRFEEGFVTYKIGLNQFSIYTEEEKRTYIQARKDIPFEEIAHLPIRSVSRKNFANLPGSLDWRDRGVINAVKHQLACGSCWIFAAIAGLESAYAIQKGINVSLSEQQLVDCLQGCAGGWWGNALAYIRKNGGVNYDRDYPYTGNEQECRYDVNRPHVTVTGELGHVRLPDDDEIALQEAVVNVGPIIVGIEVAENFWGYQSGVIYSPTCTNKIDHAVTVIGYGRENGLDYWLVRNSWGPGWGDKGYVKMARNMGNNCAIASAAIYATI